MFDLSTLPEQYKSAYTQLINKDMKSTTVVVFAFYHDRLVWTKASIKSLLPEYAGVDYRNYRLYLINNNSTDTTDTFLNEFSDMKPFVTQIRHNENKGKPWAFNHALEQVKDGEFQYAVSIDGDVAMPKNWLRDMIICYEELGRGGINVGQLACDYHLMPGCIFTVNPNSRLWMKNPDESLKLMKIFPSGVVLDTYPDVAGGCILWKLEDIKKAGGYQIIASPSNGRPNLYGMDDGLINLYMKQNGRLSCYLMNVRAWHWGDYDALLFPKYYDWKQKNLNPVRQRQISPHEIGVEFRNMDELRLGMNFKGIEKFMRKKIPEPIVDDIAKLYEGML